MCVGEVETMSFSFLYGKASMTDALATGSASGISGRQFQLHLCGERSEEKLCAGTEGVAV